jgi:type IV pilus assembly protein PilN
MIRINLLGEETVSDNSGQGLIACYAGSLVLAVLLCLFFRISIAEEITEYKQTRDALERDLRILKQTTAEVRELEKRRDELKAKLTVIALLKKSKAGPVHVMESINNAIPERAWVVDAREKGRDMTIQGMALDNISVSDFAKQLMASEFFQNVEIIETKTALWKDATIRQFTIKARVNYAGRILPATAADQSKPLASTGSAPSSGDSAASSSQGSAQALSAGASTASPSTASPSTGSPTADPAATIAVSTSKGGS